MERDSPLCFHSAGWELSAETGENNTSNRIDRGAISQCRQRSAGAKWQAVEDQRGEDQRDRATSRRRLKKLGTGLKLSHIKTYRAHLDRGSGGQKQSKIALPPCAQQLAVDILRRAQAVNSVPNPTARSASRSVETPRPGFLFGQERASFPRGRQGKPGGPESRCPVPRGGGARLRGSRRAAFAGA